MLYLVATPIGNLKDFTLRAIEVLNDCDIILCEDTRHSGSLLHHYSIKKPLKSYHKFNEESRLDELIHDLKAGQKIALLSDAGTPCISDPGYLLVKRCHEEEVPVTVIPGACAVVAGLTLSGFNTDRFQFVGFLPKKESELKEILLEIFCYQGTSVCYESPHRIVDTLKMISLLAKDQKLAIAREISKLHEECLRGTAEELLSHFETKPPLGEMVLLFEKAEESLDATLSPEEQVKIFQESFGLSLQEAIKLTAKVMKVPKRSVYKLFV